MSQLTLILLSAGLAAGCALIAWEVATNWTDGRGAKGRRLDGEGPDPGGFDEIGGGGVEG